MIFKFTSGIALACLLSSSVCAKDMSVSSRNSGLYFLENKGQVKDQFQHPRNDIQFVIPSGGVNVFIGNGQIHYQFNKPKKSNTPVFKDVLKIGATFEKQDRSVDVYRMDVTLVGANVHAPVVTEEKQDFTSRFYTISGTSPNKPLQSIEAYEAFAYKKITYRDIYPKIDWVIFTKGNEVEYEFVVHPGGDPRMIRLKYDGATSLQVNEDGSFTARTPMGMVNEDAPFSYQQADKKEVTSSYALENGELRFNVGAYTGTLVIDPTLVWGTFFGSTDLDVYYRVTTNSAGDVYATGYTLSLSNLATVGAYQTANAGGSDILLSKFSSSGTLLWSTFIGTTGADEAYAVSVTSSDVFVGGVTDVLGSQDALLVRMSNSGIFGAALAYGSTGTEACLGMANDASGDLYIVGATTSSSSMVTTGAAQPSYGGVQDGIIAKFANSLSTTSFLWGTYYGGTNWDACTGLKMDGSSNLLISGTTGSTNNIATLATSLNGQYDGFLVKFNSSGVRQFGTYVGGNLVDEARAIALDASGNIFIAGQTSSTSGLTTTGAFQTTNNGGLPNGYDGFLAKYSSTGSKQWATYCGGTNDEFVLDATVSGTDVIFGGYTSSTTSIASATGAYQSTYGGGILDGFMEKFNTSGTRLWGSYYGGSGEDDLVGLAAGTGTDFYVAGVSLSTSGITSSGALQTINNGLGDAFLSRFTDCTLPTQPGSISGATSVCAGSSQTYSVPAVTGATSYTWTLPAGFTGASTTNSITVTTGATGGTILVTANNSCGSGPAASVSINVTSLPTATITAGGPVTFCQGGSVLLSGNSGAGLTYQWNINTVAIPGATNSTYSVGSSGSYTLTISAPGCTGSSTSAATIVTVNPAPAAPTAGSNSPVCVGQSINLTSSTTTSGATYIWTGPNFASTTQNPVITNVSAANAGVYTVTVSANGCSATASTTVVVTSTPGTPGSITGSNPVCQGANLTYSVPSDPSATSYAWTLPGGWTGTSTTNSISVTVGNSGGNLSVSASNSCGSSSAQSLTTTVNPIPTVTISQSGNVLSAATTFASYQWFFNGTAIPGATAQSYTYTQGGNYHVEVSDGNCTGKSNTLAVTNSVRSLAGFADLSLFPNPNSGTFTLKGVLKSKSQHLTISVVDVAGRMVHQESLATTGNEFARTIVLSAVPAGTYVVRIVTEEGTDMLYFLKR